MILWEDMLKVQGNEQYRQVLLRLRAGDSDRDIARAKLMGRQKLALLCAKAAEPGWLDPGQDPPDELTTAAAVGPAGRPSSTISSVQPDDRARMCEP